VSAEPGLDPRRLLEALRLNYGLSLEKATFVPDGTAPAYRAEGTSGRFFVKLLPDTPYGRAASARICAEMPLLRALREEQILPRVPQPLWAPSGAPLATIGGAEVAVYGWIDAVNLSSAWGAALPELAPLLGRLHGGTPQLMGRVGTLPMPPEDFGLPFMDELSDDLRALKRLTPKARPALHELRALLAPHDGQFEHLLALTHASQKVIRSQPHDLVVCHTDAHGGNVMRDAAGELWVIDWESARLAPPEHDLWMLHSRLPEVLPLYEAALGRGLQLDVEVLAFYFCRRVLEDLAVDVAAMLRGNAGPDDDAENLRIIRDFVLPAASRVEEECQALTARL
jgi:spectinomycin phosphotransferase